MVWVLNFCYRRNNRNVIVFKLGILSGKQHAHWYALTGLTIGLEYRSFLFFFLHNLIARPLWPWLWADLGLEAISTRGSSRGSVYH